MIIIILLIAAAILGIGLFVVASASGERRRKGQAGVVKTSLKQSRAVEKF